MTEANAPEYVEARRALLDSLEHLGKHRASVIIAGAQAIYLCTGDSPFFAGVQAFTTDADLTLDPSSIGTDPALEEVMSGAGFHLRGGAEGDPGIWVRPSQVLASGEVCVDLIVPEGLSPRGGRRGARLDGHSSRAARKIFGLEAVVVDNDELQIESLEADDDRSFTVKGGGIRCAVRCEDPQALRPPSGCRPTTEQQGCKRRLPIDRFHHGQ